MFNAYKKERGDDKYLKQRYVKFILSYSSKSQWKYYVDHPLKDFHKFLRESPNNIEVSEETIKFYSGISPDELNEQDIVNILSNSYNHRSKFFHLGEQPPHGESGPTKQYFQEVYISESLTDSEPNNLNEKMLIVPNYELLIAIAKNCIINWLYNKKQTDHKNQC